MLPKQSSFLNTNFLLIILLVYSAISDKQVCDPQDESSLLAFSMNFSTSPPLNWSSSTSCCQWEGVECGNGRVIGVQLYARGLKGVFNSSTIGNIVSLTNLNLSNNELSGPLGKDILALTNLRVLDLSMNSISGLIPQEIGNLVHLEKLHLEENNLSGPTPPSLMNCSNLVELILRNNHLDGDISTLDMSKLVHLQKIDLMNNTFTGTLPASIYSCKSLVAIRVAVNNLTGQISPEIINLKSLAFFSLTQNSFTNITRALTILAKCNNLTALLIGWNFYGDALPSNSNFLGSNRFPQLQYFSLQGCNMTGTFPTWVTSIRTLRVLKLSENRLMGEIPYSIGALPNLFQLDISGNNLSGEILQKLCQLPALMSKHVVQNFNLLNFELPIYLFIFCNHFEQYNELPSGLLLSNNNFGGHIPPKISKLQGLQQIRIANNHLTGNIPASIANLTNLEVLELSSNNLTGEIPSSLTKLTFLRYLNVSYNDLEGPVPTSAQFDTFPQMDFEGNPRLCGDFIQKPCWKTTKPDDNGLPLQIESYKSLLFLQGVYVGFASGFSGVLVIVASYVLLFNFTFSRRGQLNHKFYRLKALQVPTDSEVELSYL